MPDADALSAGELANTGLSGPFLVPTPQSPLAHTKTGIASTAPCDVAIWLVSLEGHQFDAGDLPLWLTGCDIEAVVHDGETCLELWPLLHSNARTC